MTAVALLTNPKYDIQTEYMSSWSRKILGTYFLNGKILNLDREDVIEENVVRHLENEAIRLAIFNAHGNPDTIFGYENAPIITLGHNEHALKDKIVHAMACKSGSNLAQRIIECGGIAYIGYKEDFKASCLYVRTTQAQQDDILAELSFVPAFAPAQLLLEGKTVGEAYDASQELYKESLRKALAHEEDWFRDVGVLSRLYHNLENQVCLGDRSAKL